MADPSRPLRVTLAWTDDAAAAGANPTLVNDLDLVVETAGTIPTSATTSRTVGRFRAACRPPQQPGGRPDRGARRLALVRVTAASLPGDGVPYTGDSTDQDFALVCRNCRKPLPPPRHATRRLLP